MKFYILTLFPEMIEGVLNTSILGRAKNAGCISFEAINIRDYTLDKHKKVDDYPYGGGAGMVMQAQPIYDAYQAVCEKAGHHVKCIYLTPQGQLFTQPAAKSLALEEDICLLCGHYEGIDQRVVDRIVTDEVSIGDYVLTGGEIPALVIMDAVMRRIPGVLNNEDSAETESFENGLLEYPQYTRPSEWKGVKVPDIILSGDHARVEGWRHHESLERTRKNRPDLYLKYMRSRGIW